MSDWTVTIGDLVLDCADLADDWKFVIVKHRYPKQNGAVLEHMGADEGSFRLKAVFIGDDALTDYTNLLSLFRKGASIAARHPIYGAFNAQAEAVSATYDDREKTAEVSFTLLEDGVDNSTRYYADGEATAIAATQALLDDEGGVCTDLAAPTKPVVLTGTVTDPTWAEKIFALGLGNKVNSYVTKLASVVAKISALRAALTSPVSAAFNAIAFAASVPGQLAEQVAEFLDVFAEGKVSGAPNPVIAVTNMVTELRAMAKSFDGTPFESTFRVLAAAQAGRSAAGVMAKDEENLRAQIAAERSDSFDALGNYVGATAAPKTAPATPDQVGQMVVAVRQLISDALSYTTDMQPLLELALALHQQYRDRLAKYETIRTITVSTPTPLHLICVRHGLPYNTAERLVRLNNIKDPSFTQGEVRIYASV